MQEFSIFLYVNFNIFWNLENKIAKYRKTYKNWLKFILMYILIFIKREGKNKTSGGIMNREVEHNTQDEYEQLQKKEMALDQQIALILKLLAELARVSGGKKNGD